MAPEKRPLQHAWRWAFTVEGGVSCSQVVGTRGGVVCPSPWYPMVHISGRVLRIQETSPSFLRPTRQGCRCSSVVIAGSWGTMQFRPSMHKLSFWMMDFSITAWLETSTLSVSMDLGVLGIADSFRRGRYANRSRRCVMPIGSV